MTNILVTGADGQVGRELQDIALSYPHLQFIFTDKEQLDITQPSEVQQAFQEHEISYCINCAAYTAVDRAEEDQELAHQINVEGPKNLAMNCLLYNIPLLHISTDYVYHGTQSTPYTEESPTNPQNTYGRTKLAGTLAAMRIHPGTVVFRTSWVYSSFGHNFVKTMLRLGKERSELRIVNDQIGTPTYARDLAHALLQTITQVHEQNVPAISLKGIYHYSNEGQTNWHEFATTIFQLAGIACQAHPIPTSEYPTPATRPLYSVLDKSKIKTNFELEIPHWKDALRSCLQKMDSLAT